MSEMVQVLRLHIKTQTSHDDKVFDECVSNPTLQMSQFGADKSSHAPRLLNNSDETLVCSSSEGKQLKETF